MANQNNKTFSPFVPASANIPEVTSQSVLLGIVLGVVLTAANAYLGLKVGLTVSASIPAAVLSMGILRGLFRRGTILENNIVQTIAASGESLAAGIIFTIPAMVIAGVWNDIAFWTTTLVCLTGGLLGICFMIPLRRSFIVEDKTLTYPEGLACAEVLKAGERGGAHAKFVVYGMLLGAVVKFASGAITLLKSSVEWIWGAGKTVFFFGTEISPALIGVGYIVGFNVGTVVVLGGVITCLIAVPIHGLVSGVEGDIHEWFWPAWKKVRFMGVGTMIVGGIWSILKVREGIVSGLKEAFLGYKAGANASRLRTEVNMAQSHITILLLVTIATVFGLYVYLIESIPVAVVSTISMVVMSFFFVAVASYIVGLVGSSNSPVSGMTICAVLATGGLLLLFGMSGTQAVIATLGVAGVVCCAACSAGDICQDLKTGYLVGSTPKKQQWMEVVGAIIPALTMAPILIVLHHAYGIGTGQPNSLNAPQATLFASLVKGLFQGGDLPWRMVGIGIGIGIAIVILDVVLQARRTHFRLPVMAVAVGMYLPLMLSVPIFIGGVIASLTKNQSESGRGVLFASGLVAGDAVLGVLIGFWIYIHKEMISLIELPIKMPEGIAESDFLSIATLAMVGIAVYLIGKGRGEKG